jgi:hypothetical protein
VEFAGADASSVVLASAQNLAAEYEGAGSEGLFEWSSGHLRPVSVLPGGGSTGEAGLGVAPREVPKGRPEELRAG